MRVKFIALCLCIFILFCPAAYADDDTVGSSSSAVSSSASDAPEPTPTIEEQADGVGGDLSSAFNESSGGLINQLHDVEHSFDVTFPEGQNGLDAFLNMMAGVIPLDITFCFLFGCVLYCVAAVKRSFER